MAERHPGVAAETEFACIERDADVGLADLRLRLDEAERLIAALQAEMVPVRMAALGECPCASEACGRRLAAKGYYGARFRSLFGDVPVRVRRLFVCLCRGGDGAKSLAALDFSGKVAAFSSELLPLDGTQHASTVRNRMLRVGAEVVQAHAAGTTDQPASGPVVVGLDGGYVRSWHRGEGCCFKVIAGKVIHAEGSSIASRSWARVRLPRPRRSGRRPPRRA